MSGHHSITSMLTVLFIFMIIYFIFLIIYEIKKRVSKYLDEKKKKNRE